MNYQLYSKNIKLPEELRKFIDNKLQQLNKFQKRILNLHLDLSKDTHHRKGKVFRAEINLTLLGNKLLRAEETTNDLMTSIDLVKDKIKNQLIRLKELNITKRRK